MRTYKIKATLEDGTTYIATGFKYVGEYVTLYNVRKADRQTGAPGGKGQVLIFRTRAVKLEVNHISEASDGEKLNILVEEYQKFRSALHSPSLAVEAEGLTSFIRESLKRMKGH